MARKGSMDDEALCIQRSAREIEKLDDEAAQARVAFYLYLRYTAAGDRIAPGGMMPAAPAAALPGGTPKAPVSAPSADVVDVATVGGPGAADGPPGDTPSPGLDLSGTGSENDDDAGDMKPPKLDTSELDDDEAEVEI